MRTLNFSLIAFGAISLFATNANAFFFGEQDSFHKIQDIEGTDLRLCYKTRTLFFFLGIYVTDDGYVLREKGKTNTYSPLGEEQIREMQLDGRLPDPLPEYSLPIIEYAVGYSLWILIGLVIGGSLVASMIKHFFAARRLKKLLANPIYKEALRIALEADANGVSLSNGINEGADYLHSNGIPLTKGQKDMKRLLPKS